MPSRLTKLEIDEISVVENGANQRADIVITKQATVPTDYSHLLGTGLAELQRREREQEAMAREPTWIEKQAELREAMRPDIRGPARFRYAAQVAKALAANPAWYDADHGTDLSDTPELESIAKSMLLDRGGSPDTVAESLNQYPEHYDNVFGVTEEQQWRAGVAEVELDGYPVEGSE